MKKLLIIQTVSPDYRAKVFQEIKNNIGNSFELYAGKKYFESSVITDGSISFLKPLNNYFFLNRKLLFQTGMWKEALKGKVLVLELNPRIISNWILLFLRKTNSNKTVLWGHAWPRNGKNSKSDKLRNLMRKLADEIIVYTKAQEIELKGKMPDKKIVSAPNAVFYKKEMKVDQLQEKKVTNIIYVGRLTKEKKPLLLVQAFIKGINKLPKETKLIIVGEGDEKLKIIDLVSQNKLEDRIKTLGHISDYKSLKNFYSKSLFSVSPGYVGLSIIQSFGFGVPMLISQNENHSPEIEAAIIGENSTFFKTDDIDDLSLKILDFFQKKSFMIKQRSEICFQCSNSYSIENMANKFIELL